MIYETDIRDFVGIRCKIQVRQCLDGSIQQRHIWYRCPYTGECDPPRVDKWIPSALKRFESATRNMTPSNDLDELREAITALEAIAAGHNDARGRAATALTAIRSQTQ